MLLGFLPGEPEFGDDLLRIPARKEQVKVEECPRIFHQEVFLLFAKPHRLTAVVTGEINEVLKAESAKK